MLNIKRKLLTAAMGLTMIAGPIRCASNAGNGTLMGEHQGAGLARSSAITLMAAPVAARQWWAPWATHRWPDR